MIDYNEEIKHLDEIIARLERIKSLKLEIKAIDIPNQNYFNWKYRPQQIYYGNQQTKTADHTDILY